jgi:hypothetical protein
MNPQKEEAANKRKIAENLLLQQKFKELDAGCTF